MSTQKIVSTYTGVWDPTFFTDYINDEIKSLYFKEFTT